MLGGTGTLCGPAPNTQFNCVVELIVDAIPVFAAFAMNECITNEDGLNSQLALFISKRARISDLPFIVLHQSMEDLTRGDSPKPDIGIHLDTDDEAEPPPRITVFEGKRLTTQLDAKRRREYVVGHVKNGKYIKGGIERFKWSIHGGKFKNAGMIGYLQDGTPDHWRDQVNGWISELSRQEHDLAWSEKEQLTLHTTVGRVTECSSVVFRKTDALRLAHLWINLIP
jgi:hypothetical protein